ncbi:hypothetical protein J7E79_02790 [Bacillus sp. ISL-40]|uniref:hypothetical protein n=1 Tax=unclassified Bacillus (in: firmicutes) TaxID=185979 RepID=UPI001BEB1389|nr:MULTISPECIES: hypothetical protein [unclassified Bacillus (in: firmicutes)]MBT2696363.1 hypothetical protein [Bacillus sp. ISL-40]MBT2743212.1 hypothetical protein [Bacillus sp. ISL-77]
MEPLQYSQLFYNEAIYWLEQRWQRNLTPHEKHIVIEIYRFVRTEQAEEEIKILTMT